ncbi:NAD-dependent epimerase/dehydratase family protein, partial [Candidatus Pelagibacter bacterium]|nr:NAD-dependent epimerase/dehydratase family protein [Candidatus Pelagibacter bacterium]
PRVKYIKGDTINISKLLKNPNQIKTAFHFGEFARIYQSFLKMNECISSNSVGSNAVFNFCLKNKIKLIYSATSASLGNKGNDKNLSPYAFTKSKNLELLENLKKWFNFKYEVVYFYNVYGPHQICRGEMSTVIGIFEDHYKRGKPLPIVKPGTQSRRFTHIDDTVYICYLAWKKSLCRHYSIANKKSYTLLNIAKMFKSKIKYLPKRPGERYASALINKNLSNKMYKYFGKIKLSDYISDFIGKNN